MGHIRCGIVLVDYNIKKILIVRGTDTKIWSLPKGKLNIGETYTHCATRETEEETGIIIPEEECKDYIKIKDYIYYKIYTDATKLNLSNEITREIDLRIWATLDEIATLVCNSSLRSIINKTFLQELRQAAIIEAN